MSPFELCILSLLMALNLFLMQGFWFFGFQGSAAVSLLRALVMGKRKSDSGGDASARKAVKEEGEEYVAIWRVFSVTGCSLSFLQLHHMRIVCVKRIFQSFSNSCF